MLLERYHFIADENISPRVVSFLRETGIKVFDVKGEGLAGTYDLDIIETAAREERIVLIQDSDFGKLVFKEKAKLTGIIYLRPGHVKSLDAVRILKTLLDMEIDVEIPFLVVAELQSNRIKIRIRNL
jgi:predicted nuclease of predicted toxin-antitoxin system